MDKKPRPTHVPKDDRKIVITLDARKVEGRVRKPLPPPTRTHRDKSQYRRKPKHPAAGDES